MPRLLLVDDNPSIHKIVETLLAQTAIALVCAESAAEALDLIGKGERFDVALVDINMGGMDGWELVAHLRRDPATAGIPIALMAGVLDTVDPQRLSQAPIQGFIKKPVELRDLGERVAKLLETPVMAPAPIPEQPLPEPLPAEAMPEGAPAEVPEPSHLDSPFATVPGMDVRHLPERRGAPEPVVEDDVLVLTAEDLLAESAPMEAPELLGEAPLDDTLELEELDLDSLKDFGSPEPEELAPVSEAQDFTPVEAPESLPGYDEAPTRPEIPELPGESVLEEDFADFHIAPEDLPDLGPVVEASSSWNLPLPVQPEGPTLILEEEIPEPEPVTTPEAAEVVLPAEAELPAPEFEASLGEELELPAEEGWPSSAEVGVPLEPEPVLEETSLDLSLAEPLLPDEAVAEEEPEITLPIEEPAAPVESVFLPPEALAVAAILNEPAAVVPAPPVAVAPGAPADLAGVVEALKADPVLLDALAKAVVARLGNDALREVAWDVMPELAERLQRP